MAKYITETLLTERQRYFYHVSHDSNHENIMTHGIRPHQGTDKWNLKPSTYLGRNITQSASIVRALPAIRNKERETGNSQKSLLRHKKARQGHDQHDSTPITRRQQEVLTYIAEGLNNREIANQLNISSRTVEVHRFNLMRRLQVTNVAQLIRQGLLMGLLTKLFRVTEPRAESKLLQD